MRSVELILAALLFMVGDDHVSDKTEKIPINELPEAVFLDRKGFFERFYKNPPMPLLYIKREGDVSIRTRVNTKGRISDCEIAKSSGDSILDAWACRGSIRYARFVPSLDATGNPIESKWVHTFALKLGPSE